ncbi:uncharacterized protein [Populus alba]|uniref:uncharacterized protein n=1 Tax=Populus alba TaxID=43335 RepID=UPI003CC730F2
MTDLVDKLAKIYVNKVVRLHGVPISIVSDRDPRLEGIITKKFLVTQEERPGLDLLFEEVTRQAEQLLADRLAHALKNIVSPMQNAFLGGRYMSDNINLVQELLRQNGRKRSSPRCLLKVDFKKAFDSIQWDFLANLLRQLGFPAHFVLLVMECVSTPSYFIAVNGDIHDFFLGKSGVRQGDPLSPYLFIYCMEYLSRFLKLSSPHENFRFHPKCEVQGITHLAFADDVLLLSRGDSSSIHCLLQQITLFGKTSGLYNNPQKSSIFFRGVGTTQKQSILTESGFREGSFPFTYLGVPLSPHRLLASQFSPLLQDLKSLVQGWIGKHLTYAGRLELTRSTSALVAWKSICLPKSEGGLGLFDLRARNRSFLSKQLWNIHLKSDSVWIRWIHHFYLSSGTIWSIQAHHTSSPLWKAIISVRDLLLQHCGDSASSITLLNSWSAGVGPFLSHAYEFFRPTGPAVSWGQVVWEQWSLPKHSSILWLAVLGKLRTRDRLRFVPPNPNCMFCRRVEESHGHLFFACEWTCRLWAMIKSWLQIERVMQTLASAIRGLRFQRNSFEARMKRAALSITTYLIWEERNKRAFEGRSREIAAVFRRFQILFYTVLESKSRFTPGCYMNACLMHLASHDSLLMGPPSFVHCLVACAGVSLPSMHGLSFNFDGRELRIGCSSFFECDDGRALHALAGGLICLEDIELWKRLSSGYFPVGMSPHGAEELSTLS